MRTWPTSSPRRAPAKAWSWSLIHPDVPRRLVGDSLRMGQILINYANNAVKYTEKAKS